MKKIFLIAGISLAVTTVTFANNTIDRKDRKEARIEKRETEKELRRERRAKNAGEVSSATKTQFAEDFAGAKNVHFAKTKNFEEVSFMSGQKMLRAYYDYDSRLVGTSQKKTFADLPGNAQKKIRDKYAGYAIADVIKFDDNVTNETDMILYGATFADADNYFVELKKDNKAIVVKVSLSGDVSFFTNMK